MSKAPQEVTDALKLARQDLGWILDGMEDLIVHELIDKGELNRRHAINLSKYLVERLTKSGACAEYATTIDHISSLEHAVYQYENGLVDAE